MEICQEQKKYLWIGLDLDNFEVFQVLPQSSNEAAIIMRCKHPDWGKLWCIEHLGTGQYFDTYAQMLDYCAARQWA